MPFMLVTPKEGSKYTTNPCSRHDCRVHPLSEQLFFVRDTLQGDHRDCVVDACATLTSPGAVCNKSENAKSKRNNEPIGNVSHKSRPVMVHAPLSHFILLCLRIVLLCLALRVEHLVLLVQENTDTPTPRKVHPSCIGIVLFGDATSPRWAGDGLGFTNYGPLPSEAEVTVPVAMTTVSLTWPAGLVWAPSHSNFRGGCIVSGDIFLIPHRASGIVRVDRALSTTTLINTWPAGFTYGILIFNGGVNLDGDHRIFLVPFAT